MTRIIAVVFLIFLSAYAHAQYGSRGGRFQVTEVKGCAPLSVTVSIVAPDVCDDKNACDMDFEGNSDFEDLLFNYTYTQPGTYWLRINFQVSGMDSVAIHVLPNVQPRFNVYTCSGNQVSVQLDDSNYDEYILNFHDGTPTTIVSGNSTNNHEYVPGTHTVEVRGRNNNAADNCDAGGRIVTPVANLPPPTITLLEVLDNTSVRLEFDALPNVQYKLGIATNGATNFQQVGTIYNATVDTVLNLRTDDNYYCFQLAAFDPCDNSVRNSSVICSADLDLNIRNKAIDISWLTAPAGISSYRLTRTAGDGTTLVTQPTGSPSEDLDIICGTEYCYQLTSVYTNGSRSVSKPECGTGFSTEVPSSIRNISSIVGENSVVLEWQSDPDFVPAEFTIYKSVGGTYASLANTTQRAFPDPAYSTDEPTCYRVEYRDVCDNKSSLSIEACPIRLTGSLLDENSISLTWTSYEGYANGVASYSIEKYSQEGILLQALDVGTATSYLDASDDLDHQAFIYVVRARAAEAGLIASASNRITILKDPNIFHPTAFTPNNDNLNDIFTVYGQYVEAFEMKIFNRWGELLFTTDDITLGWDGTYKGNEMPEGTYTFIARVTDRAGRTFKRSGSVLLLRKN